MTREEIAERLDAVLDLGAGGHPTLADAVCALPVLATCGECGWCMAGAWPLTWWCDRDEGSSDTDARLPPPSWCPLRGKR